MLLNGLSLLFPKIVFPWRYIVVVCSSSSFELENFSRRLLFCFLILSLIVVLLIVGLFMLFATSVVGIRKILLAWVLVLLVVRLDLFLISCVVLIIGTFVAIFPALVI